MGWNIPIVQIFQSCMPDFQPVLIFVIHPGSMRLYFYCVMKKYWGRLPEKTGIAGQKIFLIKCNNLVAAVSTTGRASFPETQENLTRHEQILKSFMKSRPILPFRFNCVVGETVGRGILQKHYHALFKNLDEVKNGVEYRLKIARYNPASVKKVVNLLDRAAFRERAKVRDPGPQTAKINDIQAKVLATQIHNNFSGFASRHEKDLLQNGEILLKAEYLVDKNDAKQFEAEKERVRRLYPNIMVMMEGPLPPYNFNAINITGGTSLRIGGPRRSA